MILRRVGFAAALAVAAFLAAGTDAPEGAPAGLTDQQVRQAMLGLYIHGVDDALAQELLGSAAVPALRRLLAEPGFPRRDNVVAFLAHLDDGTATRDLIDMLASPPAPVAIPEEDRALLLAPQALGRIASRGDPAALEALMEMTEPGGDGGPLARAAALSADPVALRTDLIEMALHGLALSGAGNARTRLEEIARPGAWSKGVLRRDLSRAAAENLRMMTAPSSLSVRSHVTGPRSAAGMAGIADETSMAPGGVTADLFDAQSQIHDSALDYANHVQAPPMGDARLDQVLAEANRRAGRVDFTGDVGCCISVTRSGSDQLFGSLGDGLDIINNAPELTAVLVNSISRAKVVRQISYCGGPGTNIIGCAYAPGFGMAVVRLSDLGTEAVLWIHEFGHNTGLLHSADGRAIMFGSDTGLNNGLTQSECNQYHSPHPNSGITPDVIGVCADTDADEIGDHVDNCPSIYNLTQDDHDGDNQGDVCDADDDNDLVDDALDCAPLDGQVWDGPGEASDLTLTDAGGTTQLDWMQPAVLGGTIASIKYDVVQSASPVEFQAGASCVEFDDGPNTTASTTPAGPPLWTMSSGGFRYRLGASVAVAGRVNGDAFVDVIVGVPAFSNGQNREGRAQIHYGSLTGPDNLASWIAEGGVALAEAGSSVAPAGDVNGDGFDDFLVGAPLLDDGITVGGAVFVFMGGPTGPSTAPSLTLSANQPNARFGHSVAGAGDVNQDGFDDVIVGAPNFDNGNTNEGQAFLYLGSGSGLSSTPAWTADGGQDDAWFGQSVAGAGDINGDTYRDLIVGAPLYDNGEANEGAAFVYPGSAAGAAAAAAWSIEGGRELARLGAAVAGAGRVTAGLFDAVIVGAPDFDNGEAYEGQAQLFEGSAAGLASAPSWIIEGDQPGAHLGAAVGSAGDINADGTPDVVVGAPGAGGAIPNTGAVRIYLGGPAGLDLGPARTIQGDQQDAAFGTSVAGVGDVSNDGRGDILVGAPLHESFLPDEGFAFIFPGSSALKPVPGQGFFYLIRAENVCDGTIGSDSSGAPRLPAISCP